MKKLLSILLLNVFVLAGFSQQKLNRISPPQFPGGKVAMEKFIDDNMQYPSRALEAKKDMSVRLQIKVDKTGKIFEVSTGEIDAYGFTDEAVRIVEQMPNWQPAQKNNTAIASKYSFFIDFRRNKKQVGPPKKIEKIPSFPGGNRALRDFIIADLKYPESIEDQSIAGAVVIQVKVDETGKIVDRRVVKTLGQEFTKESYKTLDKMPLWEPGIANGEPTSMWYSIPFAFTTNEDEKEATSLDVEFTDHSQSSSKSRKSKSKTEKEVVETASTSKKKKAKKKKKKKKRKKKNKYAQQEEDDKSVTVRKTRTYVKRDSLIYLEREPLRVYDTTYKQSPTYVAPQYPGGDSAFKQYFDGTMVYPKKARKKGLQGVVKVKFRVSKEGEILTPKIYQSQGTALDNEALRIVKYMPKWIPAYNDGEPLLDDVTLPIEFVLPKKKR